MTIDALRAAVLNLRERLAAHAEDHIDKERDALELVKLADKLLSMIDELVLASLPTSPDIWSWPTRDREVTQRFGENPTLPAYRDLKPPGHEGLDIATRSSLDVYACYAGTVYRIAEWPNQHPYGLHLRVESRMPDGRDLKITYAHLAPGTVGVRVGDRVKPGQLLARVGRTGNIRGLHLHVTFKVDGAIVDPWTFLEEAARR